MVNHKPNVKPPSDDCILSMAQAHDIAFLSLRSKSHFVGLVGDMTSRISGLTSKTFVPSLVASTDCFLGPIQFEFVTATDSNGDPINIAKNVSSAQVANVAPYAPPRHRCPDLAMHCDTMCMHVVCESQDGIGEDICDESRTARPWCCHKRVSQLQVLEDPRARGPHPSLQRRHDTDDAWRRFRCLCALLRLRDKRQS